MKKNKSSNACQSICSQNRTDSPEMTSFESEEEIDSDYIVNSRKKVKKN